MEMELAKSTLQSYMKGDDVCNPTVNTLLLIAKKLHTTVTELVSDPALLERIPTKCKECVFFQINNLHPLLQEPFKQQMELCRLLSAFLYEAEERGKPVAEIEFNS